MKLAGDWRLATRPAQGPGADLLLMRILRCHEAWHALTKTARAALVALADDPHADMHSATRASLERHGLADSDGITEAGQQVVHYRPGQEEGK